MTRFRHVSEIKREKLTITTCIAAGKKVWSVCRSRLRDLFYQSKTAPKKTSASSGPGGGGKKQNKKTVRFTHAYIIYTVIQ